MDIIHFPVIHGKFASKRPIASWLLEEGSTSLRIDITGRGNNLTPGATPPDSSTDRVEGAASNYFTSGDNTLSITKANMHSKWPNQYSRGFSAIVRFKIESRPADGYIAYQDDLFYIRSDSAGTITVAVRDTTETWKTVTSDSSVNLHYWQMLVLNWRGEYADKEVAMWLNGNKQSSTTTCTRLMNMDTSAFYVGGNDANVDFFGYIDWLEIYNRSQGFTHPVIVNQPPTAPTLLYPPDES
jgi:hypothetical protein